MCVAGGGISKGSEFDTLPERTKRCVPLAASRILKNTNTEPWQTLVQPGSSAVIPVLERGVSQNMTYVLEVQVCFCLVSFRDRGKKRKPAWQSRDPTDVFLRQLSRVSAPQNLDRPLLSRSPRGVSLAMCNRWTVSDIMQLQNLE